MRFNFTDLEQDLGQKYKRYKKVKENHSLRAQNDKTSRIISLVGH
jgi:hypothetical protein